MAPGKFALFRGRSRDCPEPPSTEHLLNTTCSDLVFAASPGSPLPSTSQGQGVCADSSTNLLDLSLLQLDSDDEEDSERASVGRQRRRSVSTLGEAQINYNPLPSTNATSTTTLQDSLQDQDQDLHRDEDQDQDYEFQGHLNEIEKYDAGNLELASPDDATSIDANSLQFDQTSMISEDIKYCGATKKQRRNKAKEEQKIQEQYNDCAMWQATNYEVLQHLLSRSGSLDEQIKWEAIATARGLCTLTAACVCRDCSGGRAPPATTDGDAGIGAAPLLGAVSVGCALC